MTTPRLPELLVAHIAVEIGVWLRNNGYASKVTSLVQDEMSPVAACFAAYKLLVCRSDGEKLPPVWVLVCEPQVGVFHLLDMDVGGECNPWL